MLTIDQFTLTPEQINRISEYRRKWQKIALNKDRLELSTARLAINNAYRFLNLAEPQIVFFPDPYEALNYINREIDNAWGKLNNTSFGYVIA